MGVCRLGLGSRWTREIKVALNSLLPARRADRGRAGGGRESAVIGGFTVAGLRHDKCPAFQMDSRLLYAAKVKITSIERREAKVNRL